jgi:uncharacterized membrane protein/3-hydroxymyristoyl/3-hydroxydecanoyl-(acyl carrier protein) dehydratase
MAILLTVVVIGYPIAVYLSLGALEPRQVALVLFALVVLRLVSGGVAKLASHTRAFWLPIGSVVVVAATTTVWNHPLALLLAPALINAGLLASFGFSLFHGPCTVERFARLQNDHLNEDEIVYCRQVTWIWCAFFLLNGAFALWLALLGDLADWTLFTGLISYGLMATLFSLEFTYRQWRFRRYFGSPTDPFFRWIFPPHPERKSAANGLPADVSVHTHASSQTDDVGSPHLEPEELSRRHEPGHREEELRVPEDLACWPGHFPVFSIVPGVLQLHWVIERIEQWIDGPANLARIEALKFRKPLLPGQHFTLSIEADENCRRFRFEFASCDEIFSVGRIVLEESGEEV